MKKIKKYKVDKDNSLMLAVSFVKNPAIESKFLALEKEEEKQKYVTLNDDYRRVVYGAVLRPDLPIYRKDKDEEYYLEFDKEAIEVLAEKFMTQGRVQNFTEAHKKEVDDVSVIEVWTKADNIHDKSIALGLDPSLEVGTLFFGAKVYNDDVWQKVLDGTYEGFSIEAIVGVEELEKQDFEEQAPTAEPEVAPEPAPAPEVSKEKGILDKIMDLLTGKSMEEVTTAKPDHSKNGINENVAVEEETKVAVEEQPKEEVIEVKPDPKAEIPADNNDVAPEVNPLQEVVDNLKAEIDALKKANEGLLNKIGEISREPSAKPVNTSGGGGGKGDTYDQWRDIMGKLM